MKIQLLRADITSLKVDAIVAPADSQERPFNGNGRAVVVTGGNLLARFVIHVRVPTADDADADDLLHAATIDALDRAEELAVSSVGLPAIGTGPFKFSDERCARMMIRATLDFQSRAKTLQRTVFCLFGAKQYAAFEKVLGELQA